VAGRVYLVGAGPGDPELLTLKAAKLLARSDVVLYDSLVSEEVLALVSQQALLVNVGKRAGQKLLTQEEINSLLASYAKAGKRVVRLKGGDPLLFGRAGEEMEALRRGNRIRDRPWNHRGGWRCRCRQDFSYRSPYGLAGAVHHIFAR